MMPLKTLACLAWKDKSIVQFSEGALPKQESILIGSNPLFIVLLLLSLIQPIINACALLKLLTLTAPAATLVTCPLTGILLLSSVNSAPPDYTSISN